MKNLLFAGSIIASGILVAETVEEAYARLAAYRDVWETNAWAYVHTVPLSTNEAASAANGRWYVEFLQFPDVTDSNRLEQVINAKEYAIWRYGEAIGILDNTNAWYAVADYIAHLKDSADSRWIDESYDVVTAVDEDGVAFVTNANPILDFSIYRQEHFAEFRMTHTNLLTDVDAMNVFFSEWSDMVDANVRREKMLKSALCRPKGTIRERFWWFGASQLSAGDRAVVRSNIVERARLSQEEADSIFVEKFHFIPIK